MYSCKFWKADFNPTKLEDPESSWIQKVERSVYRSLEAKLGHKISVLISVLKLLFTFRIIFSPTLYSYKKM